MRRFIDILVAASAMVVLSPLFLLIALATRVSGADRVLFSQQRSGLHGTSFKLVKFCSMTQERDAAGNLLPDAVRVTRLGRLLRRTRLDELPELFNILRGEMSLIGPRPLLPETVREMGADGRARGARAPGLTGWAQINGNTLLNNRDKLALDLWYLDNASLQVDLAILIGTVRVMLFGERISVRQLGRAYARGHHRSG